MYDYIYQYRGDLERIISNKGQEKAKMYCHKLFEIGKISSNEWNILVAYIHRLEELKRGDKE